MRYRELRRVFDDGAVGGVVWLSFQSRRAFGAWGRRRAAGRRVSLAIAQAEVVEE